MQMQKADEQAEDEEKNAEQLPANLLKQPPATYCWVT